MAPYGALPKWNGNSMSQKDMMEKDTLLVLSDKDILLGSASKRESHVFSIKQPHGILHRAFSVFLFDESTGSLLLQKRASTKITFPNVWTNTCCSHPLHGMEPPEVDSPSDVENGTVFGAKNAAIRKLNHELGVQAHEVPLEGFKFLTRLHYWAADTITHGANSPWGEHEIDYVLFFSVPSKESITLAPHSDEVDAVTWVTQTELTEMMDRKDLLFSPWFRIIVKKWLIGGGWWENLNVTMNTDKFCDFSSIHQFDPPPEHLGGNGNARDMFEVDVISVNNKEYDKPVGDSSKKQGCYGKIYVHKESKVSQILRLDEVWSIVSILYINPLKSNLKSKHIKKQFDASDLAFCDEILGKVSRSFASVIRQLPQFLLVEVMIFYLALRALDTIEDDMNAFENNDEKIEYLRQFHKTALSDPNWSLDGVGEADEKRLLQNFSKCQRVYASLNLQSRRVISDITQRMAMGMAEFVDKDLGQGTTDLTQYNRYCHFVAGLVGEGLTRLFVASKLESPALEKNLFIADQMGLFLQKTNIIRDYLEDYVDGRAFWPQSIWKKYSKSGDLAYFADQSHAENREASIRCLNELVVDALELVPNVLTYLSNLKNRQVFRFCAIPQVMAIATLESLYNNNDVFTGVVKIRKGMACKLLLNANSIDEVHSTFNNFAKKILSKAIAAKASGVKDDSFGKTVHICTNICDLTDKAYTTRRNRGILYKCFLPVGIILASTSYNRLNSNTEKSPLGVSSALAISSFVVGCALHALNFDLSSSFQPQQKNQ